MTDRRRQLCSNCRFYCQDVDPENRLYFDERSGECRRNPPRDNFSWLRSRSYHWCGEWQPRTGKRRAGNGYRIIPGTTGQYYCISEARSAGSLALLSAIGAQPLASGMMTAIDFLKMENFQHGWNCRDLLKINNGS